MRTRSWVVLFAVVGCSRSFDLPAKPPPAGAGSLSGRLVVQEPGTNRTAPYRVYLRKLY